MNMTINFISNRSVTESQCFLWSLRNIQKWKSWSTSRIKSHIFSKWILTHLSHIQFTMTYTKAWVTLLTNAKYAVGVQVLARSLQKVQSQYPLVVLYTATIPESVLNLLSRSGCVTRPTQPILPEGRIDYMWDYYADTWTKLRAWELDELDRVVLLDADMLCMQNMDELLTMPFQEGWIAACHACTCNPAKISKYPADWLVSLCSIQDRFSK